MKSSQPTILIDYLYTHGIGAQWLEEYLSRDKKEYADRAGLSVDTWKSCLYAIMMGASLPSVVNIAGSVGKVREYIEEEAGTENLVSAYARFRHVVAPFYAESIQPWHDFLVNEWAPARAKIGYGGRRYVRNTVRMPFCLDDYREHELPRKLAAFLLQGREAEFIHTLTVLSKKYGFKVISNEHDGIVVDRVIPEEAVHEAQQLCEMPYANLERKSFV